MKKDRNITIGLILIGIAVLFAAGTSFSIRLGNVEKASMVEFCFEDNVEVVSGFYKGVKGTVWSEAEFYRQKSYFILVPDKGIPVVVAAKDLRKGK